MGDMIVLIAAIVIVVGAIVYLIRAKKRGNHCVGCPYSKGCSTCDSCGVSAEDDDKSE